MARIAGVDLPNEKRVEIGLTYIYGIGLTTSQRILKEANVDPDIRCRDLSDEQVSKIREIMDRNEVMFQFSELGRVDQGGGGTIAYILANKNMDVLDAGIPVQNMHAPYETASKGDIYEAYRAYKAFLKDA